MEVGKDLGRSETERGFGNEPYYRAGEHGAAEHGVADLGGGGRMEQLMHLCAWIPLSKCHRWLA